MIDTVLAQTEAVTKGILVAYFLRLKLEVMVASARMRSATADANLINRDILVRLMGFPPRNFLLGVDSTNKQVRIHLQLSYPPSGHSTAHKVLVTHFNPFPVAKLLSFCFSFNF